MEKIIKLPIIEDFKNKFKVFNCHPGMYVVIDKKVDLKDAARFLTSIKEKDVVIYVCAFPSLWEIGHYFVTSNNSALYHGIKIQRPFISKLFGKKARIKIDVEKCLATISTKVC